jgi:hypothetical protein
MRASIWTLATAIAASLANLPGAAAFIADVVLPTTASIGSNMSVTVKTEDYIMVYDNFGIIWGLLSGNYPTYLCPSCLGRRIFYTNLV